MTSEEFDNKCDFYLAEVYKSTSGLYSLPRIVENNKEIQVMKYLVQQNLVIDVNMEFYRITQFGRQVYEIGGWLKYLQFQKEETEEKKNKEKKEYEKLKHELELVQKTLEDYDKTKKDVKASLKVSIWSVIIAALALLGLIIQIILTV
ncbi:hypothetical protein CLU97_3372 [Chryseobacterium sp. 7]|uniref:hypothetical protein n=1 Tax=Chryseobacterium sp. 7 TaxID=2035214 RepID=UPI000EAF300E|nr:hypothetical protein [Chryseobacterium sp. 7]RLJ33883.1 hypothetical protein CLU97_3372 [Chryseobacterium sp. 7]